MRWYILRWGVILTSLVACSCLSMASPRLKVAKAEKAKIERRIQVVAKPEPAQKIILYASSSGKLKAVHVSPGDHVVENQMLFEIDDTRLLETLKTLQSSSDPPAGLAELMQDQLDGCKILAPTAGTVISVQVSAGTVIGGQQGPLSATPLGTLVPDGSELPLFIALADAARSGLSPGARCEVFKASNPSEPLPGSLGDFKIPEDPAEIVKVPLLLDTPVPCGLGESLRVDLICPPSEEVWTLPVQAVFRRLGRDVVYVMKGSVFVETEVSLGQSDPFRVTVMSGIKEGDVVTLEDPMMRPGARVQSL